MISGRWGRPSEVLLDLAVDARGSITGVVNPSRQNLPIRHGHFDPASGALSLEGEQVAPDGTVSRFQVTGRLEGRSLRLAYQFGEICGEIDVVRVEEYVPPRRTIMDRIRPWLASLQRRMLARSRPTREENERLLRERGESPDSIVFRDAAAADIAALAELHVTTWNATYNTSRGPSVATRARQWTEVFARPNRKDFVLVLENRDGQLIGFTWGKPAEGEFAGELSKIYLRWDYHGLGLGRRMMAETAKRFLERGIGSFILFAELSNPTLGFYDRLGGERLVDDRGQFNGAYGWRDIGSLLPPSQQDRIFNRILMRSRLLYDQDGLLNFRDYPAEALAALDQAVLAAADIPSIVQRDSGGETRGRVWLVIRREHLDDVRELLAAVDEPAEADPPDDT